MWFLVLVLGVVVASPGQPYREGVVVVQFEEDVRPFLYGQRQSSLEIASLTQLFSEYHISLIERVIPDTNMSEMAKDFGLDLIYLLHFPPELDEAQVAREIIKDPMIRYADPDYVKEFFEVPDDPSYPQQWGLEKIQAAQAWDITHGDTIIILGIDDTGVDWNHDDLTENIFQNLGEDSDGDGHTLEFQDGEWVLDPGDLNGIDDDGNVYTDDLIGWDFVYNDNTPYPGVGDVPEHGTHVAGIASAVTNNAIGVAGIGYTCKILPLKTLYVSNAISGLYYSVSMGVDAYNMSWGGWINSLGPTLDYARANGIVLCGAAGNSGSTNPHYPAAYPACIAIAASNGQDRAPSWSNYGDWIDVAAPGSNILSTVPDDRYESWDGTSMSAPFVTGLVGLIRSIAPDLPPESVESIIFSTADSMPDEPKFMDGLLGAGRINAYKAILATGESFMSNVHLDSVALVDLGNGNGRPEEGEEFQVKIVVQNGADWQPAGSLVVICTTEDSSISFTDSLWNAGSLDPGETASNSSDPFEFYVVLSEPPQRVTLEFEYYSDRKNFPKREEFSFIVGQPDVILVDDDGSDSLESYYTSALDSLAVQYDLWDVALEGPPLVSTTFGMSEHQAIIWFTGSAEEPLSQEERDSIIATLSLGANLFISSQYLGEQLGGDPFFSEYLKATLLSENAHQDFVSGVEGDPVSDSMSLVIVGIGGANNSSSEDALDTTGGSLVAFTYANSGEGAAIRYDGGYKLVFFGFPFESINDAAAGEYSRRKDVLARILEWFGVSIGIQEEEAPLSKLSIGKIRVLPSIFRRGFTLDFLSLVSEDIEISLFDASGRKVRTLFSGRIQKGEHSLKFSPREIPSGVYFITFKGELSPLKILKVSE